MLQLAHPYSVLYVSEEIVSKWIAPENYFKSTIVYYSNGSTCTLTLRENAGISEPADRELQSVLQNNVIKMTTKISSELTLQKMERE